MFKKILLVLLVIFLVIQVFHPKRNKSKQDQPYAIAKKFPVPDDVKAIMARACYDCHTNNTRYPWYCYVQPVDWWTDNHVKKGKKGINFDEYTNKSLRYQYHKMEEVEEQVKEGKMPLNSYLWIHKDAKLTPEEKNKIIAWTNSVRDSLEAHYPMDSLVRKKTSP